MLPFRVSNKNKENMELPPGSLIIKSTQSSLKYPGVACNGSFRQPPHQNNSSTSFPAYPAPSIQFRRRQRPLHLQMNQLIQNTLHVPNQVYGSHRSVHMPLTTTPVKNERPASTLMPPAFSFPAGSPGLDQVLTEVRPGPNVAWFCERKRPKSQLWSYWNVIVCILVLLTVGFGLYKMFNFAPGTREGYRNEVENESFQDYFEEDSSYAFKEEDVEEVEKPLIILDGNNSTEIIGKSPPAASIKILYSINEDFESTIEVIEG